MKQKPRRHRACACSMIQSRNSRAGSGSILNRGLGQASQSPRSERNTVRSTTTRRASLTSLATRCMGARATPSPACTRVPPAVPDPGQTIAASRHAASRAPMPSRRSQSSPRRQFAALGHLRPTVCRRSERRTTSTLHEPAQHATLARLSSRTRPGRRPPG